MDDLGFSSGNAVVRTVSTVAHDAAPARTATVARGTAATSVAHDAKHAPKLTGEEKQIRRLQSISNWGFAPWTAELASMMGLTAGLSWVAKKIGLKSASAWIKGILRDLPLTMRKTDLAHAHEVGGKFMTTLSETAKEQGADRMATATAARAVKWTNNGKTFANRLSETFEPVAKFFHKHLENFSKTSLGKKLGRWTDDFASWRSLRSEHKLGKTMGQVKEAFTTKPGGLFGWVDSIRKSLFGYQPPTVPTPEELKSIVKLTERAARRTGAARVKLLQQADKAIQALAAHPTASAEVKAHAASVGGLIERALGLARDVHGHTQAAGRGLMGAAGHVVERLGRVSVFNAVVAAGITAGIAAIWMTTRKENREAKQALKELTADIGDPRHPIVMAASKMHNKQGGGRWVGAGLNSAAQGSLLMAGQGFAGGSIMLASQMGLPELAKLVVPENHLLNAYASLKQAEQGKLKLPPEQKLFFVKQLVAAVPAVSRQGGQYNKLAGPIAARIIEKNMTVKETMQFLADHEKFVDLAGEVAADQKQAAEAASVQKKAAADTKPSVPTIKEPVTIPGQATPAPTTPTLPANEDYLASATAPAVPPVAEPVAMPGQGRPTATALPQPPAANGNSLPVVANDDIMGVVRTSPETAALTQAIAPATDKPAMTIAAAKGTAQGRVIDAQRAMAQPA